METTEIGHAYHPECHCDRCVMIGEGHDPALIDRMFKWKPEPPMLFDNVIRVDFRKVRKIRTK